MIYLISTEVKGFNYYMKINLLHKPMRPTQRHYSFEGLKNNATQFKSIEEAKTEIDFLPKRHYQYEIIPYK